MKNTFLSAIMLIFGLSLIGYLSFVCIPESLFTQEVRILDSVAIAVVFGLWMYTFWKRPVNLKDKSSKEVGGLGLKWTTITIYSILTLLFIGITIYVKLKNGNSLSFEWQALIQGVFLFILLGGLIAGSSAESQVKQVYNDEQRKKEGKRLIKTALTSLNYAVEDNPKLPRELKDTISRIASEGRFITPSDDGMAIEMDERVITECENIKAALYDYEMNKEEVARYVGQLERDLQRRRSFV